MALGQAGQVAMLQHVHEEPGLEVDLFEVAAIPVEHEAFVEQFRQRQS